MPLGGEAERIKMKEDKIYKDFYKNTLTAIKIYAEECVKTKEPMDAEMLKEALEITLDDEGNKGKRFKEVMKKFAPDAAEFADAIGL